MSSGSEWTVGRVGMLYRDITPESMKTRVVVSHICLPFEGEVPDYVHYHKIDFQMIYCRRGRIKVVYEDQGPPFWLETGDCVLQPPEIRHRVLECMAGAEVIEVTMPAAHETLAEHEIKLPTNTVDPAREFGGQRFFRYISSNNPQNSSQTTIESAKITEACTQLAKKLLSRAEIQALGVEPSQLYEECCLTFIKMLSLEAK